MLLDGTSQPAISEKKQGASMDVRLAELKGTASTFVFYRLCLQAIAS